MASAEIDLSLPQQDHSLVDLTRLLSRLEHSLLAEDVDHSLKRSSFQRTRVGANIEYAHNLILRLEHANQNTKTQSPANGTQADLLEKRVLLKKLQDRLYELNQLDDESLEDSSSDDQEAEEDLLAIYAPASIATPSNNDRGKAGTAEQAPVKGQSDATTESQLRSRRNVQSGQDDRGSTTGAAVGNGPKAPSSEQSTKPFNAKASDSERLLEHHTSEQESLTTSLLDLATSLKTNTLAFSDELTSSNPLVDRTVASLDKNVSGMEGAERRMGMLRRMTEGKGWWGRMSLYGYIAVLWVALILIMFVMPKLRF